MSAPVLLAMHDLHAGYRAAVPILHGVTESVAAGEIVTIIGPNGAGKSTLLRAIFGELKLLQGGIRFAGEEIGALGSDQRQVRGIGFVPQGRCNFPLMSVRENLMLGCHSLARAERAGAMERILDSFPMLRRRLSVQAGNLSGGEQQILEMAMVLTTRPRLLLLDEPSLGLAPITMQQVFETVVEVRAAGVTILIVEQNTAGAIAVSDRVWVLELGRLIASGEAAEMASNPRIRQAYLGG
ncbi:MAG: ABC transporter ATP-binding protein [Burkholderiaceae bacterium]